MILKNINENIKPNKDDYNFDQLSCFEKAIGIAVDGFNDEYSGIFYMYIKLYQVYNRVNQENNIFKQYTIEVAEEIINKKFGLCCITHTTTKEDLIPFINEKIDLGSPVLVIANLRELYYSKQYQQEDWSHLFIVKGYDNEKSIYKILDNLHIDPDRGQYRDFVLEYETMKKVFDPHSFKESNGIIYFSHGKPRESFSIFLDCINSYLSEMSEQPYKEIDYINCLMKNMGSTRNKKQIDFMGKIVNVNVFINKIINTIKFKRIFFQELLWNVSKYLEDSNSIKELDGLVTLLIGKWEFVIHKSIIKYHTNKKFNPQEYIEDILKYEEKIKRLITKIRDALVDGKPLQSSLASAVRLPTYERNNESFIESLKKNKLSNEEPRAEKTCSDMESLMLTIWKDVLGTENIGINDNLFFLGGDSIKAINIIIEIQIKCDIELTLTEIFENPTIESLSEYLKSLDGKRNSSIVPVEKQDYYPLSMEQKRIHTIEQFNSNAISFNMPKVFIINGNMNRYTLEQAFKKLIIRHEALRTSFIVKEDEMFQKVHQEVDFSIKYTDQEVTNIDEKIKQFIRPFDIECAPLLRVELSRIKSNQFLLMIDMHHIISDGVSFNIVLKELMSIYENKELSENNIHYKEYSLWQNKIINDKKYEEQKKYWQKKFSGELPILCLHTDYKRPSLKSYRGDAIESVINQDSTSKIKNIIKNFDGTLHSFLLAVYMILLSKYSGQDDIIVGTITSGRKNINLQNTVGMFVKTYALRNHPNGSKTFLRFFQEVKKGAIEAYENQDYQLEELLKDLKLKKNPGRNPLFDTMFIMQNFGKSELRFKGVEVEKYYIKHEIETTLDISLTASEANGIINLNFEYAIDLFKRSSISRLCEDYITLIEHIINDVNVSIREISMLKEKEMERLQSQLETLDDFSNVVMDFDAVL